MMRAGGFSGSLSPEARTTFFYLTFFMGPGAAVMFLPIWLSEKGITPEQIGLINAVPVFAILAVNMVIGRIADRAEDWRGVIVVGALIAGVAPLGLFIANDFVGILLIWTLASLPGGGIAPVLDAATMRMTRRNNTDFGTIRAWGTVGFMLFNALTGLLVVWFGSAIFVPLFVALMMLRALVALQLPRFRAPPEQLPISTLVRTGGGVKEMLAQPWFTLPLVGFCIVIGTHFVLNAFASLLWKEQGISEAVIGPLIALGAGSEAAMMFAWKRFGGRISARHLMLAAAVVSVLRWTVMAFSPPVAVLVLLQLSHGITFALGYLGCVHFIANWTSEDIAAETQSLFTVGQQATSVLAAIGFGWLVAGWGAHAFLAAAAMAAVGAACIAVSLRLKQPKSTS